MFFNSLEYAVFLPLVFIVYWWIGEKRLRFQNGFLLVASYFFYSFWDWRFLFLLAFSTFLDFYTGLRMQHSKNSSIRKTWFWLSIIINLGILLVFKYYDFFVVSFSEALDTFGLTVHLATLNFILPVGISFYTFHGVSYVIDIYKGRIEAEERFIDYAVFVSFFPLLVAGPIERATHLLPQIKRLRSFNYIQSVDGLRQILWGLFKKIVIADNCAIYANEVFSNSSDLPGSMLFVGAVLFAFQIYGDFSGYSDIALGTARLFGIELLKNFSFPYFSRDIAEFWRRWHISLSSWFRDYLYIPLGGSTGKVWTRIRNTFIIFLVSGFWHGANWTFIIWGALNALYFMPLLLSSRNRKHIDVVAPGRLFPGIMDFLKITLTFNLTVFAWIFFRSSSVGQAWDIIRDIFSVSFFSVPRFADVYGLIYTLLMLMFFLSIEWFGRSGDYAISRVLVGRNKFFRWTFYAFILFLIGMYIPSTESSFIYFQF
jgi:alginate O-acetyltransferase complex protein AlgI